MVKIPLRISKKNFEHALWDCLSVHTYSKKKYNISVKRSTRRDSCVLRYLVLKRYKTIFFFSFSFEFFDLKLLNIV